MGSEGRQRTRKKTVISFLAHLLRGDERDYIPLVKKGKRRDWMPPAPNKGLRQALRASGQAIRAKWKATKNQKNLW